MAEDALHKARSARTMADLVAGIAAAGHGKLLETPLAQWLDSGPGQRLTPTTVRALARAGFGMKLGAALRAWGYTDWNAPDKVREALLASCATTSPPRRRGGLYGGMASEELKAWAREHGLEAWLGLPPDRLVPDLPGREGTWLWHIAGRDWDVHRLLTTPAATGFPSGRQPPMSVQNAAIAVLDRAAAAMRAAREEPEPLLTPPPDTRLRPAWDKLRALAASLPLLCPPVRATDVGVGADPPSLVVSLPASPQCRSLTGRRVVIDLSEGEPAFRCACDLALGPLACGAARVAAREAAASISHHGSLPVYQPLAEALAAPPWRRMFDALDTALSAPVPELRDDLVWLVEPDGYQPAQLRPGRLKVQKKGTRVVGVDWRELREPGWRLTELDGAVLAALAPRPHDLPSGRHVVREPGLVVRALRLLAGASRLHDPDTGLPVAVRREAPVGVLSREGDRVNIAVRVGAAVLPLSEFLRMAERQCTAEEAILALAGDLVLVDLPVRTRRILQVLAERGASIAADGLPELVRRLPILAEAFGVEPAPELAAEVLPLGVGLRARLAVDGTALVTTLRIDGPAGEPLVPGAGPAHAFSTRGDELIAHARDFEAETARAGAWAERMRPGERGEAWSFREEDPGRSLDLLGALQDAGHGARIEWSTRPRMVTRPATANDLKIEVGKKRDWFAAGGELDLDGVRVPLGELLRLMREGQGYIPVGEDRWLRIEQTFRERLRRLAASAGDSGGGVQLGPTEADLLEELRDAGVSVTTGAGWERRVQRIREAAALDLPLPEGLSAELRPYQQEGFRWMARLAHWSEGAVLADDMGLGKTLQAIALLLRRAAEGPALVVAPTSVGFNWVRECARFAPSLKVRLLRGADRAVGNVGPGDVLVTSYDLLVRDAEALSAVAFGTLVLDEAQAIKNATTRRARVTTELRAGFRLALTGTPVENRLSELWSLFRTVEPGLFGSWESFRSRWSDAIERSGDTERRKVLAARIRPFVLRRVKSEVARELPPRTEVREDVVLSSEERKRYDNVRSATLAALAGLDPHTPVEKRRFQVLAALTRLRQLACDPALVDPEWKSGSAKLSRLSELVEELVAEDRRVLVFSQYTSLLDRVEGVLSQRLLRIDGSTPEKVRRERVDAFQRGEADVFLLSLKAGGTGLNLTAASDVVILDPWWNPAVEDQAADRAHRIGQKRAVTIYRLVTCETVEEQILEMHAAKRDLVAGVLEGTGSGGSLGVEELMGLLRGGS